MKRVSAPRGLFALWCRLFGHRWEWMPDFIARASAKRAGVELPAGATVWTCFRCVALLVDLPELGGGPYRAVEKAGF